MYRVKAGHLRRYFEYNAKRDELVPVRLATLTAGHVDGYIENRRQEGASSHTIHKELVTLRLALKHGKRAGKWIGDVAAIMPVGFSRNYTPRSRYIQDAAELGRLLENLPADHAARVAYQIATSANLGECRRASRSDITATGETHVVHVKGTKTEHRPRDVPMVTPWQRELLAYALKHAKGEGDKLFRFDAGYEDGLRRAISDAEIDRVSSNDLRRTFCHWMCAVGMPRDLTAACMGHASTTMVNQVYGRLDARELQASMARAIGAPYMPQIVGHQMDLSDALDSGDGSRSAKMLETRRAGVAESVDAGDLKSAPRLPTPREYKRNRSYDTTRAPDLPQRGVVITMPRRQLR